MLFNSIVPFLCLLIIASTFCDGTDANPLCPEPEMPIVCIYGTSRNWCLQDVCRKGPGEMCGGPREMYGLCGRGMLCINDRCRGCSMETLECF